ncbi:hypothetical protein H4R19_006814, partial [Coemansia spiralis]
MVLFSARLKRTSVPTHTPPALRLADAGPLLHAHALATPGKPVDAVDGAGGDPDDTDEAAWHGAPVFDAAHWLARGGMELVREIHSELGAEAEALTAVGSSAGATEWVGDCLALRWPRARVIDIEYDAHAAQPDSAA